VKVEAKRFVAGFLIFVFLLGIAQTFVPVTKGQQGSSVGDREYWLRLARNAWNYFQPGVGVDSTTGLHNAGLSYPYFTDWDLGVYIQAIIDANQLGILSASGDWGSDARFTKIVSFLQSRQLSSNGLPFVWYESANGNPHVTDEQNAADTGELLVALNNLRLYKPELEGAINYVVYNRTNYASLERAVGSLTGSSNLYDYYVASGFASFWPSQFSGVASSILNNIVSAPTVSAYGVSVPMLNLTCEPLLLSVFNLPSNANLEGLAKQVYLAHEARHNATGKYVAFSEGNTGLDNPSYVYEWVVTKDGSTWAIYNGQDKVGIVPIIYFKAAVGLLAMFNTSFTENMASYVESKLPNPTNGYSDGVDENGRVVTTDIDKTNSMIIQAALYAIDNPPSSTPSPSQMPTLSPAPGSTPAGSTTTPSGNATPPLVLSPSASDTPSPSSSVGPSETDSSAIWLVGLLIAVILVLVCVLVLLIVRFRGRNSGKSGVKIKLFARDFRALFFCSSYLVSVYFCVRTEEN
jgi:hypothetical protein